MEISAASPSVQAPAKPRTPERDRTQEYRAEQQRLQQQAQQRQVQERRREQTVVNTQGQTSGRIVNETA